MPHFGEDWDEGEWPLGYLITIRTYGTWLHGDERLSVDKQGIYNSPGAPKRPKDDALRARMRENMKSSPFRLNAEQRAIVHTAIEEVCRYREYALYAVNVRSNHGHVVVAAETAPEKIADAFKAYSTRKLRELGLIGGDMKLWSRGRSRRYLWKAEHLDAAIDYVLFCQGDTGFEEWYAERFE